MTQQNVLKLLKGKKKWMTSKEITKLLGISCANNSLKKLFEHGEIFRKEAKIKDWRCYQYKIK